MTKHSKKFNSLEKSNIFSYVICHLPPFERELINYIGQSCWAEEGSIIKIKWQLKKCFTNSGWLRDSQGHLFYVPNSVVKNAFKLFEKSEREIL